MGNKVKPTPPDKFCNARNRSGSLCKKPAGWGTDHKGSGRCRLHGGVVGEDHGAPKGSQNALKHGIYARLFDSTRLNEAAEMAGNIDAELAIARLQMEKLLEQMAADHFDLTKLEVKTLGVESPEQHEKQVKAARAKDAQRCGEYYDAADDDFGLEQESQPVEIKHTRERTNWRAEFIRLTNLIARLEKQRLEMVKDKVIIASVEKSSVAHELNQMTDDELDRQLFSLIARGTNPTAGEDEPY